MGTLRGSVGGARELVPARNYLGIVTGVFDLGTQTGGQFGPKHQILIRFELHTRKGAARDYNGEALTICRFENLSMHAKAGLRRTAETLEGRAFTDDEAKAYDPETILGKSCRVQVAHEKKADGSMRDKIAGLMALDEDDDAPDADETGRYFEIDPDRHIPDYVPEWVAKIILRSTEFGGAPTTAGATGGSGGTAAHNEDGDDIPF